MKNEHMQSHQLIQQQQLNHRESTGKAEQQQKIDNLKNQRQDLLKGKGKTKQQDFSRDLHESHATMQKQTTSHDKLWNERRFEDMKALEQKWPELNEENEEKIKQQFRDIREQADKTKRALDLEAYEIDKKHETMIRRQKQEIEETHAKGKGIESEIQERHEKEFLEKENQKREINEKYNELEEQLQKARDEVRNIRKEADKANDLTTFEQIQKELIEEGVLDTNSLEEYFSNLKKQDQINELVNRSNELNVDIKMHEHRDAKYVRKALDKTGQDLQSAHDLPQFLSRLNPSLVNARSALATLLPPPVHKIFDQYWKKELNDIRNNQERQKNTTIADWIKLNESFWKHNLNPALENANLEPFTRRQISSFVDILTHELIIRSNKNLYDKLILQ